MGDCTGRRFFCFLLLFTKISTKEQFPLSLGSKRARRVVDGPNLDHTHPPLSSACSIGRFEIAIKGLNHGASAQPWNQVSVAPHTQTPLQSTHRKKKPEPRPCILPCCPTVGTLVVPLVMRARFLGAWLALPSPSLWLLQTIKLMSRLQTIMSCVRRSQSHWRKTR